MKNGALAIAFLIGLGLSGLFPALVNGAYAADVKGKIEKMEKRQGGHFTVILDDGLGYLFTSRDNALIKIDGRSAKEMDLRAGMICNLDYYTKGKRNIKRIVGANCKK